jgi:RNA polymerase sigma-70 factor, ECF subfamily
MEEGRGDVTVLLGELTRGNESALDKLLPLVYDELHRLARGYFRDEKADHTLQATALVHEAYLRLVDVRYRGFESRRQFVGFAAALMRRILVDHARERRAQKRGGYKTTLDESIAVSPAEEVDVLALDEALSRLEAIDPDQSRVVELRYFGGLSIEETAELLEISAPTVKRRWSSARAWLKRELRGKPIGSTA